MAEQNPTKNQKSIFDRFSQTKKTEERLTNYMAALNEKRSYAQEWMEEHIDAIATKYHQVLNAAKTTTPDTWSQLLDAENHDLQVALFIPVDEKGTKLSTFLMEQAADAPQAQELLQKIPLGIPRDIFNHIDEKFGLDQDEKPEGPVNQAITTDDVVIGDDAAPAQPQNDDFQEKKYSFWDKVTGKDKEDTAKLQSDLQEAEKRLLSVQTEQPYYIDAFFDWVEDSALVTKSAKYEQSETVQNAKIQDRYKEPSYMLRLAQADLDETIDVYTECANDMARDYHKLVSAYEHGSAVDVADNVAEITRKGHADRIFKLAMSGAAQASEETHASYIDWGFKNFDKPKDQALLLIAISKDGQNIDFAAHPSDAEKFKFIFDKVMDRDAPMPVHALKTLLQDMQQRNEWSTENVVDFISNIEPSPIQQTVETYRDDKAAIGEILNTLLNPSDQEAAENSPIADTKDVIATYMSLLQAEDEADITELFKALPEAQAISDKRVTKQAMILAYAVDPDFNLVDMITENFGHNALGRNHLMNLWSHAFAYGADMPTAKSVTDAGIETDDIAIAVSHKMVNHIYTNMHDLENIEQAVRNIQEKIIEEYGQDKWRDILTNASGTAEMGLIEKINKQSHDHASEMADMLRVILAPETDNAARVAIIDEATANISENTKTLEGFSTSLSGYYPNLRGETVMNPDNIQNIWASNEGVYYNSHGSSNKVAAKLTPVDSLNYIQTITNNHHQYDILGDELIKPNDISFGWIETSNTATYFNYYYAGASNQITLDTMEEGADYIQKLAHENDNMISLSDDNSILLNKEHALRVFYDEGQLYQLLQYHNKAGKADTVYLETECPEESAKEILAQLAENEAMCNIGDDVINLDEINLCWYDQEAETLQFFMKGMTFYTDQNGEVLKDSPLPGITMNEKEAQDFLANFVDRSENHIHINGLFLNTDLLSSISYDEQNQEMLIQTEQRDISCPIDPELAAEVISTLSKQGDFFTGETNEGDLAVVHKQGAAYIFADDNDQYAALVGGRLFGLTGKVDVTGDQWVKPDLVDAAFNMKHIDEISLKANQNPALVIKSHGVTNEIALNDVEHGRTILSDIVTQGRNKLGIDLDHATHAPKLDTNIYPALDVRKKSPIEYGILSARSLFNQTSLKANESIQSLFKQQARKFKQREQEKAQRPTVKILKM